MRSNFAIRRSLTNVCSWDQMEWNVTGDVTIGTVDADEELCPRYMSQMLYAGQSSREIVPFLSDF